MNLKNKVAIVTGASSGIGLALSKLLTKEGVRVVLASRSEEKLNELSKELPGSMAIKTDVTIEADIENLISKTIDKFGKIDILVNNAGRGYDSPVEKINKETFEKIFELDLLGPYCRQRESAL